MTETKLPAIIELQITEAEHDAILLGLTLLKIFLRERELAGRFIADLPADKAAPLVAGMVVFATSAQDQPSASTDLIKKLVRLSAAVGWLK